MTTATTIPSPAPVMGGIEPPPTILSRVAIGDFLRRTAQRDPARTALVDGGTRLSYGALDDRVSATANALLATGLAPGERVATLCNNSADFVAAFFGIHRAGLIWVPTLYTTFCGTTLASSVASVLRITARVCSLINFIVFLSRSTPVKSWAQVSGWPPYSARYALITAQWQSIVPWQVVSSKFISPIWAKPGHNTRINQCTREISMPKKFS